MKMYNLQFLIDFRHKIVVSDTFRYLLTRLSEELKLKYIEIKD